MGVPISNVTRRVVYAASGTGPYNFSFEILAASDIAVYRDDTLLTLTSNYTVTINANGTGYVTLTAAPTGATQIAIVGNRTISRSTDFVTGGDFFANTLNDELDQQTIFAQQNAEGLQRALQAPQTDPTSIDMTLPRASLRAGKMLAFDSNGDPTISDTIGSNRGNWSASRLYYVRDIVKDTSNSNIYQCLVEHTSSGSQPISTNTDSAKWFLLVDAAAAATSASNAATSETNAAASAALANDWATKTSGAVAGGEYSAKYHAQAAATSASNASTSASNAASARTAAEAARDQTLASFDSFDDRYLGAKTSDPTLDNDGNALVAGALYFNSSSGIMKVYTGSAWVAAYVSGTDFLAKASNLSDLQSASTARTNLGLGTAATMTGPSGTIVGTTDSQTLTNKTLGSGTVFGANVNGQDYNLSRVDLQDYGYVYFNSGTTNALDYTNGSHQRWAPNTGAQTLSITNWPPTGNLGELLIEGVNLGAATITWPTINWIKSDGTTTTTFSSNGVTLQSSGIDWVVLWTRDAGTTIYGKIIR